MADAPRPSANVDVNIGKMAVDWGLITNDQLRSALVDQSRDVEQGRIPVRRLGEILLSNGLITKSNLEALLRTQRSREKDPADAVANDMRFAQFLIQQGIVTPKQVNECQRIQAESLEAGRSPVPPLSELLVQKGFVGEEVLRQVNDTQQRTTLACVQCGKRYPVTGYDPLKSYRCRDCRGDLVNTVGMMSDSPEDTGLVLPFAGTAQSQTPSDAAPRSSTRSSPAAFERGSASVIPAPVPYGKYLLLREIGRGGMAVVYEAKDTTLDRRVALKMMIDNPFQDPGESAQDEERFLREARFCASLSKHPNIVSVYEAGVMEGKRYIVMEYIDGHPMSRWRRMGSLSVRQQIALLRDVALAVHFAHDNGVIHRDLKPQNVLVDEERRPHITDFGLAKAVGDNVNASLTAPRMTVGTPQYMSPEQAKGLKTVDRRTDVWSLGVMLFEFLTGRPPFTGVTPIEILMKVVNNPVPMPSQVLRGGHPALDKSIETVCMRALAKDPKDRYATAKVFAEDLSRWLKGEEVRPPERSAFERLRITKLELPAWVHRLVPYAAALAVAGIGYSLLSRPADTRLPRELERAEEFYKDGDFRSAFVAYSLILRHAPQNNEAFLGRQRSETRMNEADERERADIVDNARREADAWAQQRISQFRMEKEKAETRMEESRRQVEIFAGRSFLTLPGHTNSILAVAYSPDGQALASSSFDNSIRIWDVKSNHTTRTLSGAFGVVLSLAFSHDSRSLLAGGSDTAVRVWDVASGETRHLLSGHAGPVTAVAWSPAGTCFASAGMDRLIRIWDAATGKSLHVLGGHADAVFAVVFSPDGKLLASAGGDRQIRLWSVATGREVRLMKGGHTGAVRALAFDPLGSTLASGGDDKMVMLWDVATGNDIRTRPGHADSVLCVAFARDGRTLASGGRDKTIKLWDAATGETSRTLYGHTAGVRTMAFSPDGKVLASGAGDFKIESDGRISVWGNVDTLIRFWGASK